MNKKIVEGFKINQYNNGNCHIKLYKDTIDNFKAMDNKELTKVVNELIGKLDLYLNVVNGYHYLMNFDNSIAYDIYYMDNFIMEIEDLIKGKEKVLILTNLPKREIKSINQDLSNGF